MNFFREEEKSAPYDENLKEGRKIMKNIHLKKGYDRGNREWTLCCN